MNSSFLLFSLLLLKAVSSLYIFIPTKKTECVSVFYKEAQSLKVSYFIPGYIDEQYIASVYEQNKTGTAIWTSKHKQKNSVLVTTKNNTDYYFCFSNKAKKEMKVTFKFEDEKFAQEEVSVDNINTLSNAINKVTKNIEKIDFNIKSGAANRESHAIVAHSIRKRITMFTSLKIIFLLIFSAFQIYMITSVVQNVKVVKKIEMGKHSGNKFGDNKEFL